MSFEFTPYILPLYLTALLTVGLVIYLWRRRSTPEAIPLFVILVSITFWTVSYSLELLAADLSTKLFWAKVEYFGILVLPLAWLYFALRYSATQMETELPLWTKGILYFIPSALLVMVWTPSIQDLFWRDFSLRVAGPFLVIDYVQGVGFWLMITYSYSLFLYGSYLLFRTAFSATRQRRTQITALLIGVIAPLLGNAVYVFEIAPLSGIDYSPFAFAISGLALTWAMLSHNLTGLIPIARSTMIGNIQSGVIVLDKFQQIEFINARALSILGVKDRTVEGLSLQDLCPNWSRLQGKMTDEVYDPVSAVVDCHHNGEMKWFDVNLSPLADRFGAVIGHLLMFRDITTRYQERAELRKLRQAVEASGEAIYMTDEDGVITYVNSQFTELYGYAAGEVIGRVTPEILKTDQHYEEENERFWQDLPDSKVANVEFVHRTKSGEHLHIEGSINPVLDDEGEIKGYLAIQRDVTEEHRAKQNLRDRVRELSFLNELAEVGVKTVDEDRLIHQATQLVGDVFNPDFFGIMLIDETESVLYLHSSYQVDSRSKNIKIPLGEGITGQVAQRGEPWYVPDVTQEPAYISGNLNMRSELCVPLNSGEGVIGVINMESEELEAFEDADLKLLTTFADQLAIAIERSRLFEQVQNLAITDELTGLHNRRHFFELAQAEFARATRYGHPLSVMMVDVDRFKDINDTYGHAVGDEALIGVAARLKDSCRSVDIVARYGGEEFVIVMPETKLDSAVEAAERLRRRVDRRPLETEVGALEITISLGVTALSEDTPDLQTLLNRADQALLMAKSAGRNCVQISAVHQV